MEEQTIAFNARAIFTWTGDRLYRIYVRDDALYFIRIGGQDMGSIVASQFGLAGALADQALRKRTEGKRQAMATAQDQEDAQDLLGRHKHNFRLTPGDVLASSIEPAATLGGHGPHVARWVLTLPDKKWTLEFLQMVDVELALTALPRFLGERHKANVRYDERKKRYVKA